MSMTFSAEVLKIAREESEHYNGDIEKAARATEQRMRQLEGFHTHIPEIITAYARNAVWSARTHQNHQIKAEQVCPGECESSRPYVPPPKVIVGKCKTIQDAYHTLYEMKIGSSELGRILGADLKSVALQQRAQGEGALVNFRFLIKLSKIVPKDKTVRQAVPENKLKRLFCAAKHAAKKTFATA